MKGSRGRVTVGLVGVFVAASQWSGVVVGPLQFSDLVLVAVLAVAILGPRSSGPVDRLPFGVVILLLAVLISTVFIVLVPPSPTWLTMRFTGFGDGGTTRSGLGDAGLGPWAFLIKLAAATIGAWVAVRRLHDLNPAGAAQFIGGAWLTGATVSAVIAVAEWKAGLDLSGYLTQPPGSPRASGLAFHPNSLALYTASAIPFTARLLRRRRLAVLGVCSGVVLWAGVIAADSRIGLVVAVMCTLSLPLLVGRGGQAALLSSVIGLPAAPFVVVSAVWLLTSTRLTAGGGAQSDAGRHLVLQQAWLDFMNSPIWGIGFDRAGGAPSAPLAVLAGGGLVAATGFAIFYGWGYRSALTAWRDIHVRMLLATTTAILAVTLVQNNLTDRGQYVCLLTAVVSARSMKAHQIPDGHGSEESDAGLQAAALTVDKDTIVAAHHGRYSSSRAGRSST